MRKIINIKGIQLMVRPDPAADTACFSHTPTPKDHRFCDNCTYSALQCQ